MKTDYLIFPMNQTSIKIKLHEINGHDFARKTEYEGGLYKNENGFI
ncbi:hypothetical protein GCM10008931_31230 [Oceanobacillus oncorhynchi subsp. oncorhynchi]